MRLSIFVRKNATQETGRFLQQLISAYEGQQMGSDKARLFFIEFDGHQGKAFTRKLEQRIADRHDMFILHCKAGKELYE